MSPVRPLGTIALASSAALLAGCDAVLLSPSGDVAAQQRDLILWSAGLMSLIIVPVIVATFVFVWRYRATNTRSRYAPNWDHSTILELFMWAIPLLIIIALGAMTWVSTHKLDPYRPLSRVDSQQAIDPATQPLPVRVISLRWKWLFIYPEQNIATVNELAAPVDRPIEFKMTADTMMNSFFVPALAGQIYTMAGMQTQLHAVINEPGEYKGFSANYSGGGFSNMRFTFKGLPDSDFDHWVERARNSDKTLSRERYLDLTEPSRDVPVRRYSDITPGLYHDIVNRCVVAGKTCMDAVTADATQPESN